MASTDTLVRMMHPDWDGAQVSADVDGILGEAGRGVAARQTGAEGQSQLRGDPGALSRRPLGRLPAEVEEPPYVLPSEGRRFRHV